MINENNWKKFAEETPGALRRQDAEMAFMRASSSIIEDKAAPFFTGDYFLGFEIVKTNDTYTKMIGIFAFRVAKNLFYVPVFYMDGSIKGTDLLYSVDDKLFTCLTPDWCDYYVNKCEHSEAYPVNRDMNSKAVQDLQLQWLAYPPFMMKGASEKDQTQNHPDKPVSMMEVFNFLKGASSGDEKQDFAQALSELKSAETSNDSKPLQNFVKKSGYKAFEKIASWIEGDFEFANNVIKLLNSEDWMPDCVVHDQHEAVQEEMKKKAAASDFTSAKSPENSIIVHKGKFNPHNLTKTAAEQMAKGYSIEDTRPQDQLDVIIGNPEEELTGIDTRTMGIYDVLTTDNDIKRMFVIKGNSDYGKVPAVLIDVDGGGVVSYDNTNEDFIDPYGKVEEAPAGIHGEQKPKFTNILAQRIDTHFNTNNTSKGLEFDESDPIDKLFTKFLKTKPEKGKLYGLYEPLSTYISDEAFYISKVGDADEDGKFQVVAYPARGYDYFRYETLMYPSDEKIITVSPNVQTPNIDLKFFPKTLMWIELPTEEWKLGDKLESKGMASDSMSTKPKDDGIRVKQLDYVPGTLATYTGFTKLDANIKQASVSYDRAFNKYRIEIQNNPYKGPFNKVASTVKLMHDLNISEADATEILDNAKAKGIYRFDHKKIAGRIILNPDPDFFEGFDSDLGVKVEVPETRVVKTQDVSMDAPAPRYGDISPTLVNGINTTSPASTNSDTQENVFVRTATPNALAAIADASGMKSVFEHGVIASLAKSYDATSYVAEFLPDMQQGADKLGRLLFLIWSRPADFIEFYGADDLTSLENNLLGTFKQFCEIILELKKKTKDTRTNLTSVESE